MDLFGPAGCPRLGQEKIAALEAFGEELIAYAVAQPRHPLALRALADYLEHHIRSEITPDLEIDYDAPAPVGVNKYLLVIGYFALDRVVTGYRHIAIGARSGYTLQDGARCILIGDDTDVPTPDAIGFVNIDNRLMFWRDTGELAHV